jgi:MerR HTH family regulatory protein
MYSLSEVEEIVFSNRRTIQFWVEAEALIPTPQTNRAGRGNHRSFDASEVVVACILRAVSQNNLPIGRLIVIATALRDTFFKIEHIINKINLARTGSASLFLIVEPGLDLVFSIDPDPKEIYEHTVEPMMVRKSRDTSSKTIVYLTPWLERAPAPLL